MVARSRRLRSLAIILRNSGKRALRTLARVGFARPTISHVGKLPRSDIDEEAIDKSGGPRQVSVWGWKKVELVGRP